MGRDPDDDDDLDLFDEFESYVDDPYKDETSDSLFDALREFVFEYCDKCDYEGPLDLQRKCYVCPNCRNLILPTS